MDQRPRFGNARSAAIDLGAGSGRVIIGNLQEDSITLDEVTRFQTPAVRDPTTGYQCWDIERILEQCVNAIHASLESGRLDSLGADSWAVDFVLLDKNMKALAPPVCYREAHTSGMMDSILDRIPRQEVYARTGIQFQPFNTLYQLAGLVKHHPQLIASARRMLMIPDYLHFRLSGVAANEYTNATTTQLLKSNGEWDEQLFNAAGATRSLVGTPVGPGTTLGRTTFNRKVVQVIAPATHDTASAVVGTPLQSSDEAFISSGTWSLMGFESMTPFASTQALKLNVTNEGGYDRRFRVLKNIMGLWPLQRFCAQRGIASFATLMREAELEQPWRSIVNVDDPAFLNPPDMAGTIAECCTSSGQPAPHTPAQFARCILDSLALRYGRVKKELEQLRGRSFTRIRIVGGGSQNRLLNQLCADVCGMPVSAGPVEASALGNLVVQWIALGALHNLEDARKLIAKAFPCEEFVPRNAVPPHVWERFETMTGKRLPEEVECP